MIKVIINGNTIEVSDIQLLGLISSTITFLFDSAKDVYTSDLLVQPLKTRKSLCDGLSKSITSLDNIKKGISDDNLLNALADLKKAANLLIDNGENIHNWISINITKRKNRASATAKSQTESGNGTLRIGFPFPEWYSDVQFQDLLGDSSRAMEKIIQSTEQTIKFLRIQRQGKNIKDLPECEERVLKEIPHIRSIVKGGIIKLIQDYASDQM
jgi:hypothetical protein